MESFFKVKKPEEVLSLLDQFGPCGEEELPLDQVFNRVLSRDMVSPEDLPGFVRSTMDGYAVRAKDTFGASEGLPALFAVVGEIKMGENPTGGVGQGQAMRISTGGMLPDGADGVVMVEYCHSLDAETIEVSSAISPLENVIQPGDDIKKGSLVLPKGHRLRPQDLGVLAGLGFGRIPVFRQPTVAIISTGDEIVSVGADLGIGQVRDINRYTLGAFCRANGAIPEFKGICPDSFERLRSLVEEGLEKADAIWLSGGSSVGTRDLTLAVFETFDDFELLVHGISISPGKPTIIARSGGKPLVGLPGHVASALIVAEVFMAPLLARLSGAKETGGIHERHLEARLSRNIESKSGREDYIRVRLRREGGEWLADPIYGKSGLISPLVEGHGMVKVGVNTEGLYEGDPVDVFLFR
ncbi:MAG: molybdopterin molybdotransferase MoeA [Deltaproteobacteria bacterium]|nr:molybdopterin molybdotransferase MoeA [Deltaproteobacteria bacterium]